ncbi:MAG: GNAT family N-acetyltransferase [Acidobacteriota bacterium]|nr:GNAT family N-acetyltransferase [Acidobacteriota bacterium]
MIEIRGLSAAEGRQYLAALAEVLLDCVEGGASVSFMASLSKTAAESFFEKSLKGVENGERILLAAFIDSKLVGTVQILTAMPPNQPHRADIAKLLVLRSARARGVGTRLMEYVEKASRNAGKTLLVLDTVTGGSAEKLYLRLGWTRVGVIPNYALFPDGRPCDTTFFWKDLFCRSSHLARMPGRMPIPVS